MTLLLTTIAIAVTFGYVLFKIYHTLLMAFIKKMNWDIEKLKTFTIREDMKVWDNLIQIAIFGVIIYKIFYST